MPNRDVRVQAQPAMVTATAYSPSIKIRTHLWILWARIAIKHEAMAQAARNQAQQPGVDLGPLFEAEMDASLTGICAAAFALEALSRELEELGLLPPATVQAWTKNRPSDAAVTLEVLKVAVDPKGMVNHWSQELPWLFKIRGQSVHYEGSLQAPQPHPLGTNTGPAQVTYSIENTTRAIDLLVGILEPCRDKPKSGARSWSQAAQGIITQLIGSRGQTPWTCRGHGGDRLGTGDPDRHRGAICARWRCDRGVAARQQPGTHRATPPPSREDVERQQRRERAAEILAEVSAILPILEMEQSVVQRSGEEYKREPLGTLEALGARLQAASAQLLGMAIREPNSRCVASPGSWSAP